MSLGYQLPGTTITEESKTLSFNTSSSRRRICAIGTASPRKRVKNEEVIRAISGDDLLAYSENSIYKVLNIGSQKGLSNFKEGTHFQLLNNRISWLPKIYNKESVAIADVLTPINYNVVLSAPVAGKAKTAGYCQVSTAPNTIIGSVPHQIPAGAYTFRVTIDGGNIQTYTVTTVASETWSALLTKMNTAIGSVGTIAIDSGALKFTSATVGSQSSMVVSDGVVNGLFSALNRVGTYQAAVEAAVTGVSATSGYAEISLPGTYLIDSMSANIAAGTYNISIAIDGNTAVNNSIVLAAGAVWGDLISALNSVSGVSCSLVNGVIRVASDSKGASSSVALTAGTSNDLVAAIVTAGYTGASYGTGVAGSAATQGYGTIGTSPTSIVSGVRPGLPAGTYYLKVNANNTGIIEYAVSISADATWDQIVSAINASSLQDVIVASINSTKLRFTSKIAGDTSSIVITDGTTSGFISALTAITGTYTYTVQSPIVGKDAESGYAEIESTPEAFEASTMCNVPSGVYNINVAIDGGVAVVVPITVVGATQTWADLISALQQTVTNVNVALIDNKIRISSKTSGTSSAIVITEGTTNGFITVLNNLTSEILTVKVGALNYDHAKTDAKLQFIKNNITYDITLNADTVEGATVLTVKGTPQALELISTNTSLYMYDETVWLTSGAKYYVNYEYVRPESDYLTYKVFSNFSDLQNDLGDDIPENKLVMWANLALEAYRNADVAIVQVPSETKANFLKALNVIADRPVQTVVALTTDATVRSYVFNHVVERSLPESKRYRISYFGAAPLTPVGDADTAASVCGMATALKSERTHMLNATRALYYYNDVATGEELSTVVDGSFIAAALAAYRDSFVDPTTTLLGKTMSGLELFDEDFDAYYADSQLIAAGTCSCFLVSKSASGGIYIEDDLTTDNSTVERNNTNIITAKDYIATDIARQINATFKGRNVYNVADYIDDLNKFLKNLMSEYKRNHVIAEVSYTSAVRKADKRDTFIIKYGYEAVYTHKYTEGTFELV